MAVGGVVKDPRREYEAALADFSQPGNRWSAKGRLTYWGRASGLTAEDIVADARAAGVKDRDADIRRGWNDAKPKGDRPQGGWRHYAPRAKPKPPPTFPRYVRDLIGDAQAAQGAQALSQTPVQGRGSALDALIGPMMLGAMPGEEMV